MASEIERKFLVTSDAWRAEAVRSTRIVQAYLSRDPARIVRIRQKGEEAFLTIKGAPARHDDAAPVTPEFEYPIPPKDAADLLALALPGIIEKTRHEVIVDGMLWEVDEFHGDNAGLIVAEIELNAANDTFTVPGWLGAEVTDDRRYSNAALSQPKSRTPPTP